MPDAKPGSKRPERLRHMSEKFEIQSVEMVRRIRDELANILKDINRDEDSLVMNKAPSA